MSGLFKSIGIGNIIFETMRINNSLIKLEGVDYDELISF